VDGRFPSSLPVIIIDRLSTIHALLKLMIPVANFQRNRDLEAPVDPEAAKHDARLLVEGKCTSSQSQHIRTCCYSMMLLLIELY